MEFSIELENGRVQRPLESIVNSKENQSNEATGHLHSQQEESNIRGIIAPMNHFPDRCHTCFDGDDEGENNIRIPSFLTVGLCVCLKKQKAIRGEREDGFTLGNNHIFPPSPCRLLQFREQHVPIITRNSPPLPPITRHEMAS